MSAFIPVYLIANQSNEKTCKWLYVWSTALGDNIRGLTLFDADLSDEILFTDISRDKMGWNCISTIYQLLEKVVTWSSLSWNDETLWFMCIKCIYSRESEHELIVGHKSDYTGEEWCPHCLGWWSVTVRSLPALAVTMPCKNFSHNFLHLWWKAGKWKIRFVLIQ